MQAEPPGLSTQSLSDLQPGTHCPGYLHCVAEGQHQEAPVAAAPLIAQSRLSRHSTQLPRLQNSAGGQSESIKQLNAEVHAPLSQSQNPVWQEAGVHPERAGAQVGEPAACG